MGKRLKQTITLLTLAGIGVSAYLTYLKITNNTIACNLGECGAVQNSKYSEMFGIPVALLGLLYYLSLLVLLWSKFKKGVQLWALWGLIYSSYLTILELFVLKVICGWCVISFVIIIIINLLVFKEDDDLSSSRSRRI
jgi:uncharacterized membrane protein